MAERIFLVEDDINFGSILKAYLEMHDYEVSWETDGAKALDAFEKSACSICILDVMLPHKDGFAIATDIRKRDANIPLIFLTAKTLREDVLKGFKTGADDYITKPFDSEVLLYKIRAILKRQGIKQDIPDGPFCIGIFQFDVQVRRLIYNQQHIQLSPKEAALLEMLYAHKNAVMPRKKALNEIWGTEDYFTTRSMDVYISKLRKYLSSDPSVEILNIHGTGFRLQCPDDE